MHYYFPWTGNWGAVVVSADDYGSVIAYESEMKKLKGMAFVVSAFQGRQVRFLRWGDVLDAAETKPSRMLRPMQDDTVCVIDYLEQTNR